MAINLADKYSSKVDERFKLGSLTEAGVNHDYKFDGVKGIKIYSFPTVPLNDYDRTKTSNRYGDPTELGDSVQEEQMTQDKSFTFTIDNGNNKDSLNLRDAGKALRREIDEVVIPTQDQYTLETMYNAAVAAGNTTALALTKANVYESILDGNEILDENKVPQTGRVIFISNRGYKLLKLDPNFVRNGDLSQKMLVNGQVGEIDGIKVIKVPKSYLTFGKTVCDFIITHPSATVSAEKIKDYKIHKDPVGINGNVVEGRIYYDAFVLDSKKGAIFAHTEA